MPMILALMALLQIVGGDKIHGLWSGSPPDTRGRSPVRKSRTPGSVRGVSGNGYPYRDITYG